MAEQLPDSAQQRVFVLEIGGSRPFDVALGLGTHELKDCGVMLQLDYRAMTASSLGHGPRAFLLPSQAEESGGPRELQKGQWDEVQDRARLRWAGREWLILRHALTGLPAAPARGICLNATGSGLPAAALLLVEDGKDRGNFYRIRTAALRPAPGVEVVAVRAKDGTERLSVRVGRDAPAITLDAEPVPRDSQVPLRNGQKLVVAESPQESRLTLRVFVA